MKEQLKSALTALTALEESMSRFYWICPKCGAHLDPGEKCDCEKERKCSQNFIRLISSQTHGGQKPKRE